MAKFRIKILFLWIAWVFSPCFSSDYVRLPKLGVVQIISSFDDSTGYITVDAYQQAEIASTSAIISKGTLNMRDTKVKSAYQNKGLGGVLFTELFSHVGAEVEYGETTLEGDNAWGYKKAKAESKDPFTARDSEGHYYVPSVPMWKRGGFEPYGTSTDSIGRVVLKYKRVNPPPLPVERITPTEEELLALHPPPKKPPPQEPPAIEPVKRSLIRRVCNALGLFR